MSSRTGQSGVTAVQAAARHAADRVEWFAEALLRRARLLREPKPKGVSGPPARLLVAELGELARRGRKTTVSPRAQCPRPVLLIPGFFAHPRRMRPLHEGLASAGHRVEDWGLGFNLGPTPENFRHLLHRVETMAQRHGEPVALVGWSLGGLYAREIARRVPGRVSCVITLGSPFSGNMRANNGWRAYQAITGHSVDAPPVDCEFSGKPPVRTVALWSPRDGVVNPRSAAGWPGERDEAVSLRCTHLGFSHHPTVVAEVLRQLDLS